MKLRNEKRRGSVLGGGNCALKGMKKRKIKVFKRQGFSRKEKKNRRHEEKETRPIAMSRVCSEVTFKLPNMYTNKIMLSINKFTTICSN